MRFFYSITACTFAACVPLADPADFVTATTYAATGTVTLDMRDAVLTLDPPGEARALSAAVVAPTGQAQLFHQLFAAGDATWNIQAEEGSAITVMQRSLRYCDADLYCQVEMRAQTVTNVPLGLVTFFGSPPASLQEFSYIKETPRPVVGACVTPEEIEFCEQPGWEKDCVSGQCLSRESTRYEVRWACDAGTTNLYPTDRWTFPLPEGAPTVWPGVVAVGCPN